MRTQGLVDSPQSVGLDGHLCWGFDDSADIAGLSTTFLTEGADLGQQLMFVGGAEAESVIRDAEPTRSMLRDGILAITPFNVVYPGGRRMDNADQWALYEQVTAQAVDAGFTGLRVVAEVTSLAESDGGWHGQAGWERYADRRMAAGPLAALCLFDTRVLSQEAMSGIACVHPVADRRLEPLVPFQLFGQPDALALAGEVDAFSDPLLGRLLALGAEGEAEHVLDLAALRFIEQHGLRTIYNYVRARRVEGCSVTLRGQSATFQRLAELLGEAG